VTPANVTILKGESKTVDFTITAMRDFGIVELLHFVDVNNIRVENSGNADTSELKIDVLIEAKLGGNNWTPVGGPITQTPENQLFINETRVFNFNNVPFILNENATEYRVSIRAFDGSVEDKTIVTLNPASVPTIFEYFDEEATVSDTLGGAPTGLTWDFTVSSPFPRAAINGVPFVFSVTVQNLNAETGQYLNLINTATLTENDSSQSRTDTATVRVYTGDTPTGGTNPDPEPKDEISYPAAPAVAGAILKEKGLENKYPKGTDKKNGKPEFGNYIAEVAKAMSNEAKFPAYNSSGVWNGTTYILKSDVEAYKTAVYNFLKSLNPSVF
jgi:hypothetical protein